MMQAEGVYELVAALPRGYSSVLQTNATLLTIDIASRLRSAGLNNMTMTLHDEEKYRKFVGKGVRTRILTILKTTRPAKQIVIGYWFRDPNQIDGILRDAETHQYEKNDFTIRILAYVSQERLITKFTDAEIAEIERKMREMRLRYISTLRRRDRFEFYRTYFEDLKCTRAVYLPGGVRHETPL